MPRVVHIKSAEEFAAKLGEKKSFGEATGVRVFCRVPKVAQVASCQLLGACRPGGGWYAAMLLPPSVHQESCTAATAPLLHGRLWWTSLPAGVGHGEGALMGRHVLRWPDAGHRLALALLPRTTLGAGCM